MMRAGAVVLAVLLLALGAQSWRLTAEQRDLAEAVGERDAAVTRLGLVEESERSLVRTRDGLAAQVAECQRANARADAATRDRAALMRSAKTQTARPGEVVDDETSRRAALHLNAAR